MCPQLVPRGVKTRWHLNEGYVCMGVCIDFVSVNKHAEKNLANIRSFDLTLGQ